MNLGVPKFPAMGSQQVAGSGRNKFALKPGRSLMDWIRLTQSRQDLNGIGGRLIQVTPEELAKHNKPDDIWICIRGKVYNVTPYMEFHPGGLDELMKGAGQDATQMFDEVHRWVNFESMLEKCLVGKLEVPGPSPERKGSSRSRPTTSNSLSPNGFVMPALPVQVTKTPPSTPPSLQSPRYEWFQAEGTVTIVIYTKWNKMLQENVIIDYEGQELTIAVCIEDHTYILHVELENDITTDYKVEVSKSSGKTQIVLQKAIRGQQWQGLGKPLERHQMFKKTKDIETKYRTCRISALTPVTHDTWLFSISLPEGSRVCVPLGHHVHVKAVVQGMEVVRSYTAVQQSLKEDSQQTHSGQTLHLMIKLYQEGALTSYLSTLKQGDEILISNPEGSFDESQMRGKTDLIMYAAGTGFTPMVRLLLNALHKAQMSHVKLVCFNKTEKDIPWKSELEQLAERNPRLDVIHILSAADESWQGLRGRLRPELVQTHLPPIESERIILFCACGPTSFTKEAIRLAREMGYEDDMLHAFIG